MCTAISKIPIKYPSTACMTWKRKKKKSFRRASESETEGNVGFHKWIIILKNLNCSVCKTGQPNADVLVQAFLLPLSDWLHFHYHHHPQMNQGQSRMKNMVYGSNHQSRVLQQTAVELKWWTGRCCSRERIRFP